MSGFAMLDWFTLRQPIDKLPEHLRERIMSSMLRISCYDKEGVVRWEKQILDIDELRSDSVGLFWQAQSDGTQLWLAIGGSPASLEHDNNVFGSSDPHHCAEVLVRTAMKALSTVLPPPQEWQMRRADITENYLLPGFSGVKQVLRYLLNTDASRQRASSANGGGDTVVWGGGSDITSGKAYHKGPQLRKLCNKGKAIATDQQLDVADRLLRLELKKGSRYWRRFQENGSHWWDLTEADFNSMHNEFFGRFFGSVEVVDMGSLLEQLEVVAPTPGQALSAHRTWALIRAVGVENAKASMPRSTWGRHLKALRLAGLSDTDLCASAIVPFRRHLMVINEPVKSWPEVIRLCV